VGPRCDHMAEYFELAGVVAKQLGSEGFPRRQGAEIPVEFPGSGFEQPRVQTVGGHPALLAKNLDPALAASLPWCHNGTGAAQCEMQATPQDDRGE
jgi:hypothetical protein